MKSRIMALLLALVLFFSAAGPGCIQSRAAKYVKEVELYFNIASVEKENNIILALPVRIRDDGIMIVGGLNFFLVSDNTYKPLTQSWLAMEDYMKAKKLIHEDSIVVRNLDAYGTRKFTSPVDARNALVKDFGVNEYKISEMCVGINRTYGSGISEDNRNIDNDILKGICSRSFYTYFIKPALSTVKRIDLSALYFVSKCHDQVFLKSMDAYVTTGEYLPYDAQIDISTPQKIKITGGYKGRTALRLIDASQKGYIYVDTDTVNKVNDNAGAKVAAYFANNSNIYPERYKSDILFERFPKNYSITINDSTGNGAKVNKDLIGKKVENINPFNAASLNVPTAPYYNFTGWYYLENGKTKEAKGTIHALLPESMLNEKGELVISTKYEPKSYNVVYKLTKELVANENFKIPGKTVWKIGSDITPPKLSAKYYEFKGWYKEPSYKTKVDRVTKSVIKEDSKGINLYADFKPQIFKANIKSNIPDLVLKNNEYEYSIESMRTLPVRYIIESDPKHENLTPNNLSRAYNFLGYYNGEEEITSVGGINGMGIENVEVRFEPATYTLKLDANGGTSSIEKLDVTFDKTIEELPVPERTGYIFLGWFINDQEIKGGAPSEFLKNVVALAKWEKIPEPEEKKNGKVSDTENSVNDSKTKVATKSDAKNTDVKANDSNDISVINSNDSVNDIDTKNISDADSKNKIDINAADKADVMTESEQIRVYRKLKVSGLSARKTKKGIYVSWNKKEAVKKYQIQISTSKSFKKKYTRNYKTAKSDYIIKKGLKPGKKYYIRVRSVKKIKGKQVKGKWSNIAKVKYKGSTIKVKNK